jgi:hypothetical protein
MESTSNLKTNDISNLDKILSLIVAKGKINNSMVAKHLSLDRLESDFIFNTFCTYADNIDIIKAEFFNSGSAAIVSIHKPQLKRFIDSGGFTEYFKEKEETPINTNTLINYGQIGNAAQSSSCANSFDSPIKQTIKPNNEKKPNNKSWIEVSTWIIGLIMFSYATYEFIIKHIIEKIN